MTGTLLVVSRDCHLPGAQPFDRDFIQFWVRSNANSIPSFTPKGNSYLVATSASQ